MKDYEKIESEYEMLSKFIDEAISLVLKKKDADCIKVLESMKIFSRSLFNMNYLFDRDEED